MNDLPNTQKIAISRNKGLAEIAILSVLRRNYPLPVLALFPVFFAISSLPYFS
jgi:hypothetical protein